MMAVEHLTAAQYRELASDDDKPKKYRNKRVRVDGEWFDSAKEAKRYQQLKILQRAGKISGLKRQHRYPIHVNACTTPITTYIADFIYMEMKNGAPLKLIVEDVKSPVTRGLAAYRIKKRLMAVVHGVEILET